jgi:hypothetical protein
MDKYLTEVLGDDGTGVDNQAVADIHLLTQGQTPTVPEAPSKGYIATIDRFMQSDGFKSISDVQIKQNVINFAKAVMDKAKGGIGESGQPQSPQNPAAPSPAEQAGTVPAPGTPGQPAPQPPVIESSANLNTAPSGQNFLQRVISKIRGK